MQHRRFMIALITHFRSTNDCTSYLYQVSSSRNSEIERSSAIEFENTMAWLETWPTFDERANVFFVFWSKLRVLFARNEFPLLAASFSFLNRVNSRNYNRILRRTTEIWLVIASRLMWNIVVVVVLLIS